MASGGFPCPRRLFILCGCMVKRLPFNFRFPLVPAWGLVNIHTGIGIVRAEYIPNSETKLTGTAWSYDFKILAEDIPAPGDFDCDDLIEPYITAFSNNASCPSCFSLEQVDIAGVSHVATLVLNQCGGKACLVMTPIDQLCPCPDENPGSGFWVLQGDNVAVGNQSIGGNLTMIGNLTVTGNVTFSSGTVAITSIVTFNRQVLHNTVVLTISDNTTTWNLANGNYAILTLNENTAISNPPGNTAAGTYILKVIQSGGGNEITSWGSNFRFPGGVVPAVTSTDGAEDVFTFVSFGGTELYLVEQLNFEAAP